MEKRLDATLGAVKTTPSDPLVPHCAALSVASGDKKYIDGACMLADSDGDKILSTFDTRDTDKSQPQMSCGPLPPSFLAPWQRVNQQDTVVIINEPQPQPVGLHHARSRH
jgi:hypothetical protein